MHFGFRNPDDGGVHLLIPSENTTDRKFIANVTVFAQLYSAPPKARCCLSGVGDLLFAAMTWAAHFQSKRQQGWLHCLQARYCRGADEMYGNKQATDCSVQGFLRSTDAWIYDAKRD